MIRGYQGTLPRLADDVYVADTAAVIGDVTLGAGSSVWFGAVLRGDINSITVGRNTNVQDGSTVHVTTDTGPVVLGDGVTVGHNCVLHGCTVEDDCLVGMGAIVLDNAVIGRGSIVGAGALVTARTVVPPRSMVLGTPAKVVRPVSDQELEGIRVNARHYVEAAATYRSEA